MNIRLSHYNSDYYTHAILDMRVNKALGAKTEFDENYGDMSGDGDRLLIRCWETVVPVEAMDEASLICNVIRKKIKLKEKGIQGCGK